MEENKKEVYIVIPIDYDATNPIVVFDNLPDAERFVEENKEHYYYGLDILTYVLNGFTP
jgi:hypothetical protein